jgi:small subunit ribosomal protein S7
MSRRRQATRRTIAKDGKFQSILVSRLVNTIMQGGKKSTAQRIVYGAFDSISEKNPASNPVEILQRAVDNAKPRIETKARRVGGATYQVPLEIPSDRQAALALRWIVDFADARKGTPMRAALGRKFWKRIKGRVTRSANVTKFTKWRRQTRHLHIFAGSINFNPAPSSECRGIFIF